jgi:hypothetical protein
MSSPSSPTLDDPIPAQSQITGKSEVFVMAQRAPARGESYETGRSSAIPTSRMRLQQDDALTGPSTLNPPSLSASARLVVACGLRFSSPMDWLTAAGKHGKSS